MLPSDQASAQATRAKQEALFIVPFAQTAGMKTSRTPLRGGWDTRSRRGRDSHGEHTAGVWQPAGPGTPGARTLAPGESQSAGARSSTLRRSPEHPSTRAPSSPPRRAQGSGARPPARCVPTWGLQAPLSRPAPGQSGQGPAKSPASGDVSGRRYDVGY